MSILAVNHPQIQVLAAKNNSRWRQSLSKHRWLLPKKNRHRRQYRPNVQSQPSYMAHRRNLKSWQAGHGAPVWPKGSQMKSHGGKPNPRVNDETNLHSRPCIVSGSNRVFAQYRLVSIRVYVFSLLLETFPILHDRPLRFLQKFLLSS